MSVRIVHVLAWTLLALVGCVEPSVNSCPTVDCPYNEVCDGRGGCARQEALDVCRGKADGAMCSFDGTPLGQCSGELCLPIGCGNYFVTPGEVCDDGNTTNGDGCSADCKSNETCPNATVDPSKGEQCDDGNAVDGDGCQSDCKNPRCGDGVIDASLNEVCDSGNLNSMLPNAACRPNCQAVRCGDGVLDSGEVCDDANVTSGDSCAGDCKSNETCGNGVIDVIKGELCDDSNVMGGDGCSADCTSTEACGNGVLDSARGEVCDDGNIVSGDNCSSDCRSIETCGNMILDTIFEQCDLGTAMNSDAPNSPCRMNCQRPRCGDSIFDNMLGEACDAGMANSNLPNALCRSNCQLSRCGDMIRDTMAGELCDDGNVVSGDDCSADCRSLETCQNGILDAAKGEQCDDGNAVGTDACRNDCTLPVCGDMRLDPFEACDLGAANSDLPNAMCRENCQLPRCGDTIRDNLAGEVCDDGNVVSGDNCSSDCGSLEVCGNDIIDTVDGEQCDEGTANANTPNALCRTSCVLPRCGDAIRDNLALGEGCDLGMANSNAPNAMCRTSCQPQRCGDGVIDPATGEICDDGNAVSGDNCSADCKSLETCGNGIVDLAKNEQCDDGNLNNLDFCHNNCTLPACGDGIQDFNEQCDLGVANNSNAMNAACRPTCQLRRCGDGIFDTTYEACDDGNLIAGDGCTPDCSSNETCGNAVIDLVKGEQCDDGNFGGRDGCSACKNEDAIALQPGLTPPIRGYAAMAYDGARQRVVLFGGYGGNFQGDTWEWDGVSWTQMRPRKSPQARYGSAMAYDAKRNRIVLFGGINNSGTPRGDTWEWDGIDWVDKQPIMTAPARYYHAMAYDPIRGKVLMQGGYGGDETTWEWTGSAWVPLTPIANPGFLGGHRMVLDTRRNEIVIQGGGANRTWVWNGSNWLDRGTTPVGLPQQTLMAMAYDPVRARVVLVNGAANTNWEWDGTAMTWTPITATSPVTRYTSVAAWDAARQRIVLFGGYFNGYLQDTWLRTGTVWSQPAPFAQPTPRMGAALGYDPLRKRSVLFGGAMDCAACGTQNNETWEWDGRQWKNASPLTPQDVRSIGVLAYDRTKSALVLFGGVQPQLNVDDVRLWSYGGAAWTEAALSTARPEIRNACMAYDQVNDRVVTFGGHERTTSGNLTAETWTWHATTGWQLKAPVNSPPARRNHACSYDPLRGRTVLYGGDAFSDALGDIWEWNGTNWVEIGASGPSARKAFSMVYNPDRRQTVIFGNSGTGTEDLWEWSGTTWTQRPLDASVTDKYRGSVTYDAARHGLVTFGGRDNNVGTTGTTQLIQYRPHVPVESCTSAAVDYDKDGLFGCADPDCWSTCTPLCPPGGACAGVPPRCGDGTCTPSFEDCDICPGDCGGSCPGGVCGDFTCNVGETVATCPNDC